MRPFTVLVQCLLAVGVVAVPATGSIKEKRATCLTLADAQLVANNFKDLQDEPFNATLAREAADPDLVIYNDSINTLINQGCPNGPQTLGQPTFDSRAAYFAAARDQAPTPFEILDIWYTCDTVIVRWRAIAPYEGVTGVEPQENVTGIVVIVTTPNPASETQPFRFLTIYSEFNSFAWGYDLGIFTPTCTPSGAPLPSNSTSKAKRGLGMMGLASI